MQEALRLPTDDRAPAASLQARADLLAVVALLDRIPDAVSAMAVLLNPQRQIVLANRRMVEFVGAEGAGELLGLRPGEVLECVRARESDAGCGTTPHCTVCGSLRANMDAQVGLAQTKVCLMTRRGAGGYRSAADRVLRDRLEGGILPQATTVAAEIVALTRIVADEGDNPEARRQALHLLENASKRLVRLVHAHADRAAAEAGRLIALRSAVSARGLLSEAAGGPEIQLVLPSEDATVETDPALAQNAIRDILLNALQAAPPEEVSAGFRVSATHVDFWVHNPGEMELPVQLQVFSRAFSTKAPGRGYGAYFAKLVTERYLGGSVSFRSHAREGTTFTVRLPRARQEQEVEHA